MSILDAVKKKFSGNITSIYAKSPERIYIVLESSCLLEASGFLYREMGCRFITASGVDEEEYLEVLYHFSEDSSGTVISLRIMLDPKRPETDSLSGLFGAAVWIEREMQELLGIRFAGSPEAGPLLLPGEYRGKKFPLRKNG